MTKMSKERVSELMEKLLQATTATQVQEVLRECGTDCSLEKAQELADLNLQVKALG